ncbi:MAG: choice-of-anchor Q domain-containing protein [Anaerolineales bacterium]
MLDQKRLLILFISLFVLAAPVQATGGIIPVTTTVDEYDVTPNATCSLREAITAVSTGNAFGGCPAGAAGDTIELAAGNTYVLTRTGYEDNNATGDLDITSSMTVASPTGAATIDGQLANDRLLHIRGTVTVNLSRLSLQNGSATAPGTGGAMYVFVDAAATLDSVTIFSNTASQTGGGIFNLGAVTLLRSTIISNSAQGSGPASGGIANFGAMTVQDSLVMSNTATFGNGGGLTAGGFPTLLKNVTVSGNRADRAGGGVYVDPSGGLTLNNVTITRNTADANAANLVGSDGGGIYYASSAVIARNSIIAANVDASSSGAIYPDCARGSGESFTSQNYNLIGTLTVTGTNCVITAQSGDVFGVNALIDPLLGPLLANDGPTWTHVPLPGSPTINAGNPQSATGTGTACESADQRGYLRAGSRCDIGAVESDGLSQSLYLPLILR